MKISEKMDIVRNDINKFFENKESLISVFNKCISMEWKEINSRNFKLVFKVNNNRLYNVFAIGIHYINGVINISYPEYYEAPLKACIRYKEYGVDIYNKLYENLISAIKEQNKCLYESRDYVNNPIIETSERCKSSEVIFNQIKYLYSYDTFVLGIDSNLLFSNRIHDVWISNTTNKVIMKFLSDYGFRDKLSDLIDYGILKSTL